MNNNNNQFQGTCNYCGKFGHKEADCHEKTADLKMAQQRMILQQQPSQMEWNFADGARVPEAKFSRHSPTVVTTSDLEW